MRKLLVASQKGGVGKTTTSINLAGAAALARARVLLLDADPLSSISTSLNLTAHPQREPLRQSGVDLPGVLVSNVLPGLDAPSPYEDGGCSDDDLDGLLALLATPAFQECYGTLVVDTPPFMGANPGQLLATCDEFVLVMRAEPMAYRTLPAFLELIQRSKGSHEIKLRGILLTLASGEEPGGRWKRELRGRLGSRILPLVVPYDETAAQAALFGQIVSQSTPESPVAQTYHALVEQLCLSADAPETIERTSGTSALLLASASLKNATVRRAPARPIPAPTPEPRRDPEPPPEVFAPTKRRGTPIQPVPVVPPRRSATPLTVPVIVPVAEVPEPAPEPTPAVVPVAAPAEQQPSSPFPAGVGVLWVAVAVVVGVGLRFLKLPDYVIPILIGVGVGAAVVMAVRYLSAQEESKPAAPPPAAPPPRKPASPTARLSELQRRAKRPVRGVREN